jgi:hypothetical protein
MRRPTSRPVRELPQAGGARRDPTSLEPREVPDMNPQMRDAFLGAGNGAGDYVLVLFVYFCLFLIMRYANPRIELNFRRTFWTLFFGWGIGVFIANYVLFRVGVMSFMQWLNNFWHTVPWIGLCLGFMFAEAHKRPLWEQFALFAIFSFIVKWAELTLLGTWEHGHFFGINGNIAYITGWSLMDGLYPVVSVVGLKLVSGFISGLVVPRLTRG